MKNKIVTVLQNEQPGKFMYSFIDIDDLMTLEEIRKKIEANKRGGISTVIFQYVSKKEENKINGEVFGKYWFSLLKQLVPIFKELNMKFVIQDSAPFPTGSANGWFQRTEYKSKQKLFLKQCKIDVMGPLKEADFLVKDFENITRNSEMMKAFYSGVRWECGDELKYVIAVKRIGETNKYDFSSAIDMTNCVKNGILTWDIPEGRWSVFVYVLTHNIGRKNYMSLIDKESVQVLIDSTYVPHVKALGEEIGKTWLGFFYDEPELGNNKNYDYDAIIGKKEMALPWNEELTVLLKKKIGPDFTLNLPRLWLDGEEHECYHYEYMNIITALIRKNYSGQVYEFCKENNLFYFGHVLEDDNSHCRLGVGTGHIFRIEENQDMAGIDLISEQMIPGLDISCIANSSRTNGDGEFYHYGIARLASSIAHIDAKKKNRSFCEALALYGVHAGPKFRKFLFDFLNVNGVNHTILVQPNFEMDDCYPFGKEKFNKYGKYYMEVNNYATKLGYLLCGKEHIATAAVLYHGENEWSNSEGCLKVQSVAAVLSRNQIDFDFVPADALTADSAYNLSWGDGTFFINHVKYSLFIIPTAKRIPEKVWYFIKKAKEHNIKVVFIDKKSNLFSELNHNELTNDVMENCGEVVSLDGLIKMCHAESLYMIKASTYEPFLRFFMMRDESNEYIFFHNEKVYGEIHTDILLPHEWRERGYIYEFDLIENQLKCLKTKNADDKLYFELELKQWESKLLIFTKEDLSKYAISAKKMVNKINLQGMWNVETDSFYGDKVENTVFITEKLYNLARDEKNKIFSGEISYSMDFNMQTIDKKQRLYIDLGEIYESAEVVVNNQSCGIRFAYPYCFECTQFLKEGENNLLIRVQNNMARGYREKLCFKGSKQVPLEPIGLIGPVTLNEWSIH